MHSQIELLKKYTIPVFKLLAQNLKAKTLIFCILGCLRYRRLQFLLLKSFLFFNILDIIKKDVPEKNL